MQVFGDSAAPRDEMEIDDISFHSLPAFIRPGHSQRLQNGQFTTPPKCIPSTLRKSRRMHTAAGDIITASIAAIPKLRCSNAVSPQSFHACFTLPLFRALFAIIIDIIIIRIYDDDWAYFI